MNSVFAFSTFFSSWFCSRIRLTVSSTEASRTKIVVFRSARTSRSRITLRPVVRDSASNTMRRLASRNCKVTGRFITDDARQLRLTGLVGLVEPGLHLHERTADGRARRVVREGAAQHVPGRLDVTGIGQLLRLGHDGAHALFHVEHGQRTPHGFIGGVDLQRVGIAGTRARDVTGTLRQLGPLDRRRQVLQQLVAVVNAVLSVVRFQPDCLLQLRQPLLPLTVRN